MVINNRNCILGIFVSKFIYSKTGKAAELGEKQLAAMEAAEKLASSKSTKVEGPSSAIDFGGITKAIVSFLARNFFTLKLIALVIAFTINFMLLFYKVKKKDLFCYFINHK
jgi:ryanodine receptor 2